MAPDPTGHQDLRTNLRILWRWKFLLLAFVVLIPLGAYLVERGKPKVYASSTLIELQDVSLNGGIGIAPAGPDNISAAARLITTTPVAVAAARFLQPPPSSPAALLGSVSVSADTTTGFVTITARDHDPRRAAAIANAFAAGLAKNQATQAIRAIDHQIGALRKQLAAVPRTNPSARAPLAQQIGQLRAERGLLSGDVEIVQSAVPSANPIGPKTQRTVELALLIALLLGIGAVLVAENSDRRLRTPEDLEDLTKMPLLGTLATSAFKPDLAAPLDVEAFQMLRASLTYFNVDRPLSSVAVISPLAADGKTTVAVGLAVAVARAGKRAILVDADLRRPQVCTRLGMTPTAGLGAVLAGDRPLAEVLLEYPVDAPAGGRLLVLPAGPPPPNPAALISSQEMRQLLRQLEGEADLVIVDTAAVLAVSDALPLLQAASGIVMIVRMNRSSRAAVRRLQKVIASTHGKVMGVVATGNPSPGGYYSYSYYSDGEQTTRGPRWLRRLRRRLHPMRTRRSAGSRSAVASDLGSAGATSSNGDASPEFQPAAPPGDRHRDNL